MAIFKKPYYYNNSIVYMDTEWSADADPEINVRFAHGRFNMDYYCPRSAFVNDFKKDFTAFYEKVMKDYDEATGRSNDFEGCFDAMVEDMTEIDYRPEPKVINIDFDPIAKSTDRQDICDDLTRKYFGWDSEVIKTIVNDTITMMEDK